MDKDKRWLEKDKTIKSGIMGCSGVVASLAASWGLEIDNEVIMAALAVLGIIVGAMITAYGVSDTKGKGKVLLEAEQMRENARMNREEPLE